jgi:hypothetical protein
MIAIQKINGLTRHLLSYLIGHPSNQPHLKITRYLFFYYHRDLRSSFAADLRQLSPLDLTIIIRNFTASSFASSPSVLNNNLKPEPPTVLCLLSHSIFCLDHMDGCISVTIASICIDSSLFTCYLIFSASDNDK